MCHKCTTPAQQLARQRFLADLPLVRLATYAELQASALGPFSSSRFNEGIRNFILARLPKVPVSFVPVVCATCNKPKDARSVELDHIIPVRSYVRYKLMEAHAGQIALPTAALSQCADAAYIDPVNLIFICKACNSAKSDNQPTVALNRHGHGSPLQRLRANLPAGQTADIDQLDLIMASVNAPSARGRYLRGELRLQKSHSRVRRMTGRYRSEPYPTPRPDPDDIPAPPRFSLVDVATGAEQPGAISTQLGLVASAIETIEGEVLRMFAVSRANIRVMMGDAAFRGLLARQTRAPGAAKDLRVCLYCLGMYHKQAFQVEHIDPVDRDPVTGSAVPPEEYNDNLLGVCGSCNGSRGKKRLTQALLAGFRAKRVTDGLPGLDSLCDDMEREAINRIHQLLGL